jgi:uncharacterized repeat protein (TIGR03803 family)
MRPRKLVACIAAVLAMTPFVFSARSGEVIHRFAGADGAFPTAGLILDSAGNLYGTAQEGGIHIKCSEGVGCGTAFKLSPTPTGWEETTLYRFCALTNCADGSDPSGALIFDSAGNLYGTTSKGGPSENGAVFELSPNADGSWAETVLYGFTGGNDGAVPVGSLTFDSLGNLYGTAMGGGSNGLGVVFELTPQSGGTWQFTGLYTFTGRADGGEPVGGLIFDSSGNLYGVGGAGSPGGGVVFELIPSVNGTWTESALGVTSQASGSLVFDASGNLYGTDYEGGSYGDVFELSPSTNSVWTKTVLYSFTGGHDGGWPLAGVIFDGSGNLHGTASVGGGGACRGTIGCGVAFELQRVAQGWKEDALASPNAQDGFLPQAGLVLDSAGNLFGTASEGGTNNYGVVFEIKP